MLWSLSISVFCFAFRAILLDRLVSLPEDLLMSTSLSLKVVSLIAVDVKLFNFFDAFPVIVLIRLFLEALVKVGAFCAPISVLSTFYRFFLL